MSMKEQREKGRAMGGMVQRMERGLVFWGG